MNLLVVTTEEKNKEEMREKGAGDEGKVFGAFAFPDRSITCEGDPWICPSARLYNNINGRKKQPIHHRNPPSSSKHKIQSSSPAGIKPVEILKGRDAGPARRGLRRQNTK